MFDINIISIFLIATLFSVTYLIWEKFDPKKKPEPIEDTPSSPEQDESEALLIQQEMAESLNSSTDSAIVNEEYPEENEDVLLLSDALDNMLQNNVRIVEECIAFINTSKNIETVISRYNHLFVVLDRLSKYKIHPVYKNYPAVTTAYELANDTIVRIQGKKSEIMTGAVKRAYNDMVEKGADLKTEKARQNHREKFFNLLESYSRDFPSKTNNFIHSLPRVVRATSAELQPKLAAHPITASRKVVKSVKKYAEALASDEYKKLLMHKEEYEARASLLNANLAKLDSPIFKNCTSKNLISIYFKALDDMESYWKQRKASDKVVKIAIEIGIQIVDVFPLYKETFMLNEVGSIIGYLESGIEELKRGESHSLWWSMRAEFLSGIQDTFDGKTNLQYLRCPAYDRLISLYISEGEIEKAIQICDLGLSRNDRTKFAGGFEGKKQNLLSKIKSKKETERCREYEEENAPVEIEIDVSKLNDIRKAALETQNKLIVEETEDELPLEDSTTADSRDDDQEIGIVNGTERHFLRCLLNGETYDDILQSNGLIASVLIDSINEKLFDTFCDTIIVFDEETPMLVDDYKDELKGMIA